MDTSQLHTGDHIEANVKGVSFKATLVAKCPSGLLQIEPEKPRRYSWRFITARSVVKKLEAQERLGVRA